MTSTMAPTEEDAAASAMARLEVTNGADDAAAAGGIVRRGEEKEEEKEEEKDRRRRGLGRRGPDRAPVRPRLQALQRDVPGRRDPAVQGR